MTLSWSVSPVAFTGITNYSAGTFAPHCAILSDSDGGPTVYHFYGDIIAATGYTPANGDILGYVTPPSNYAFIKPVTHQVTESHDSGGRAAGAAYAFIAVEPTDGSLTLLNEFSGYSVSENFFLAGCSFAVPAT